MLSLLTVLCRIELLSLLSALRIVLQSLLTVLQIELLSLLTVLQIMLLSQLFFKLQSEQRSPSPPTQYGSKPQIYIDDDQIAAMLKERPFDKATGKR